MNPKMRILLSMLIICAIFFTVNPFQLPGKPSGVPGPPHEDKTIIEILPVPHPFYDSQILNDALIHAAAENTDCPVLIDQRKILAVLKILAKYSTNEEFKKEVNAQTELNENFVNGLTEKLTEFDPNPFLADYLVALKCSLAEYLLSLQQQAASPGLQIILGISGEGEAVLYPLRTGILSPTILAEALTTLIKKHFKEELAIIFLDKFKLTLQEVKDGWGLLFPTATTFLTDTETYNFKLFLPTLNAVFRDDLNNLDSNLINYLVKKHEQLFPGRRNTQIFYETGKINTLKTFISQGESLLNFSLFILNVVQCIRTGEHPAEIFNMFNQSELLEQIDDEIADPLRLMSLISRNLGNKEGNGWIKPAEFNVILYDSNKELRKLFIGLLYAKEKEEMEKIKFAKNSLKYILTKNEAITDITEYMYRFTMISESIQEQINKLKNEAKITIEEFHAYLDIVYKLLYFGLELKECNWDIQNAHGAKKEYLDNLKNLMAITQNIIDGNYSLTIVNVINMLKAMRIEDPASIKKFLKYRDFMISMISAGTADDMGRIIEDASMPMAGYRLTRTSPFSFSLSAYAGIFGGRETLTAQRIIKTKKTEWNVGLAAPIGFAFSKGKGSFTKPGPSWSLFFPIIDIGTAFFSWRLDGSGGGLPELNWKNIFAPGAFIIYGIKNSPISIGAGIQYGPQIRKIESETETLIVSSAFRVGIILAAEIPIFNFYAKGR